MRMTSLVAQMVKRLSTMWETWVRSLGRKDSLEKEMATHSSTLAQKIPCGGAWCRLLSMGSQRVGYDWATSLHNEDEYLFTWLRGYSCLIFCEMSCLNLLSIFYVFGGNFLTDLWSHYIFCQPGKPASLVAQMVKRLPAMWETQVWSLSWDNPLEKEMATCSSILTWKIPWTEKPGRLQSMGSQRVGHDWATSVSFFLSFLYFLYANPLSDVYILQIISPSLGLVFSSSLW